jgi:ATP-dependent Clp protease ATP-binding subunit ClpB
MIPRAWCHVIPPFNTSSDGSKHQQDKIDASTHFFRQVVERAHGDPIVMDRALKRQLVRVPSMDLDPAPDQISMAPSLTKVIRFAVELQKTQKDTFIAIYHLISALAQDPNIRTVMLEANVVNAKHIDSVIQKMRGIRKVDSKTFDSCTKEYENLNRFTVDMTAMAREGRLDPVFGRDEEIRQVVRVLLKRIERNPILVGEPGVGKTSIFAGLAHRLVDTDVPKTLAGCQLLSLDVGLLIAGNKVYGEFEERLTKVLKEMEESDEMVILFVDRMNLMVAETGNEQGIGAGYLFRLIFARGRSHCILATTPSGYRNLERDAMVERRFQRTLVKEPTAVETISMLRGVKECYEVYHGVEIRHSAIITAVSLAVQYVTTRRLPASAIDLIDKAAADTRLVRETKPAEIDNKERRLRQLRIEIRGLQRETLLDSVEQLKVAKLEAAKMKEELVLLEARYELNKEIAKAKLKLDRLKELQLKAEQADDIAKAYDLMYYAIPYLVGTITRLKSEKEEADGDAWNTDTVGREKIIAVVARQTGIPITQLRVPEEVLNGTQSST